MNIRAGLAVSVAVGVHTRETERVPQPLPKPTSERRKPTHTPPRSIRVPDDVWQAARLAADERGETVTDAVVRFLRRYGRGTRP